MWTSVFLAVAIFAHCGSANPTRRYSFEQSFDEALLAMETTPDPTIQNFFDYPRNPPPDGPVPPPPFPAVLEGAEQTLEDDMEGFLSKNFKETFQETPDTNNEEQVFETIPTTTTEMPFFEIPYFSDPADYYYYYYTTTTEIPSPPTLEELEEAEGTDDYLDQQSFICGDDDFPLTTLEPPAIQFEANNEDNDIAVAPPGVQEVEAELEEELQDTPRLVDDVPPPPTVILNETSEEKMDAEFREALRTYISLQVAMARNTSGTEIRKMFLLDGWITIGFNNSLDPQEPVVYLSVIPVADEVLQSQFYPDMMEEVEENRANYEDEEVMQEPELKDLGLFKA